MNNILLIGCGHMGSSLLRTWLRKTSNNFTVIDPIQYNKLNRKYGKKVKFYNSIDRIKNFKKFNIIIFAVKPQIIHQILKNFSEIGFKKSTLFISIIAGKKISFFKKFLPLRNQFVRTMPNMPALIEEGITCLVSNKNLSKYNKNKTSSLFKNVGNIIWFKNEIDLEKATAVSGSGPGYFFFFIGLVEKAAQKIGLENKIAKKLVYQTALGSIKLLLSESKEAFQLTETIAVKGGTTEAGIKILRKNQKLYKIIENCIKAAFSRAKEIGKDY